MEKNKWGLNPTMDGLLTWPKAIAWWTLWTNHSLVSCASTHLRCLEAGRRGLSTFTTKSWSGILMANLDFHKVCLTLISSLARSSQLQTNHFASICSSRVLIAFSTSRQTPRRNANSGWSTSANTSKSVKARSSTEQLLVWRSHGSLTLWVKLSSSSRQTQEISCSLEALREEHSCREHSLGLTLITSLWCWNLGAIQQRSTWWRQLATLVCLSIAGSTCENTLVASSFMKS